MWWGMEKNVCYTWLGSLWIYLYNFLKFSEAHVSHCCLITLVQLFSNRQQCPIPSSREWGFILSFHKPSLPRAAASISETFAVPFSGRANSTLKYLSKPEHILPIPTVHECVCVVLMRECFFKSIFWACMTSLPKISSHSDIRGVLSVRDQSTAQFL